MVRGIEGRCGDLRQSRGPRRRAGRSSAFGRKNGKTIAARRSCCSASVRAGIAAEQPALQRGAEPGPGGVAVCAGGENRADVAEAQCFRGHPRHGQAALLPGAWARFIGRCRRRRARRSGCRRCSLCHDELGQVKGPRSELYEALETATAAQREPAEHHHLDAGADRCGSAVGADRRRQGRE